MGVDPVFLFKCNFKPKDIVRNCNESVFREMLMLWAERNFTEPCNVNEILQEYLWYNSNIRKQNNWMFDQKMYAHGIRRVIDLYNLDNGQFMSYDEFSNEYPNVTDFLMYASLIASIPRRWKEVLRANAPSVDADAVSWQERFNIMLHKGKLSKQIYDLMRDEIAMDNSTLLILWNNDLRVSMQQRDLDKLFIMIRKLVMSTKYQYFQYRILVRALTLNIHVNRWDPAVSMRVYIL